MLFIFLATGINTCIAFYLGMLSERELMGRIVKASSSRVLVRGFFAGGFDTGKTWNTLLAAQALGGRCVVIDAEQHSIRRYARSFPNWDFDILPLDNYGVDDYIGAIQECVNEKYDVIVTDTLSKLWDSKDGLAVKAEELAQSKPGMTQIGWNRAKTDARRAIDEFAKAPCHLIYTFRSAGEYQKNGGKFEMIGERLNFAKGIEYEFNVKVWMDKEHTANITIKGMSESVEINKPTVADFKRLFTDFEVGKSTDIFGELDSALDCASKENYEAVKEQLASNKHWLTKEQVNALGSKLTKLKEKP